MDISDLQIFTKVAEVQGINKAAEQLHRVPSNITARVQKLEREVGQALFIREKNRLRISPAGEQLLDYAEKILHLVDAAKDALQSSEPVGLLRLGTMEAVAATRLSPILLEYHQAYPAIELQVATNPTGMLLEQVLEGRLDMAMVADPAEDPRLGIKPLFRETMVLVSERQHPLIRTVEDLGAQPTLLGFSHQCAYRRRLTSWLETSKRVARVVEINSYHAMLSCAVAGMGVGIVPERLLADYPYAHNLQTHALPEPWNESVTSLIWRQDSIKPGMTALIALVDAFTCL